MNDNYSGYSDQVSDFFHVYSDGKLSSSIFIDPEDFIKAINLIPQYALKNDLKVLAYTVTGTHLHMMLKGPNRSIKYFISDYKSMILRYLASIGRKISTDSFLMSSKEMETLTQVKKTICYILRNSLDVDKTLMPSYYEWSSAHLYFANDRIHSTGVKISETSEHQRVIMLKTKFDFPPEWWVLPNGLINPSCFVDYQMVNDMFKTANAFIAFMYFRSDDDAVIKRYMSGRAINELSDNELRKSVSALASDLFHTGIRDLSVCEKVALVSHLRKNYPPSQLSRVLSMPIDLVKSLY